MKLVKQLILLANIIAAILLVLSYGSSIANPAENFFIPMLGLGYPLFLIINVCFLLFWFFVEKKLVIVSLFSILIGLKTLFTFININSSFEGEISFMSYNIKNCYEVRQDKNTVSKLLNYFNSQNNEIIGLQECGPFFLEQLKAQNKDYNYISFGDYKVVLMTKFEVIDHGFVRFMEKRYRVNGLLWADLKIDQKQIIRVYTTHMMSNTITGNLQTLANNKKLFSKSVLTEVKEIIKNTRIGSINRMKGVELLLEEVKKSPYPTIIMGDFNDTPSSYTYNRMRKSGYKDSFVERGNGVGTTFREKIPFLRIDYIFHNNDIECKSFRVGNENYSDHYPIFGTYSIKQN